MDEEYFATSKQHPDPTAPLVPPLSREQVEQLDVAALLGSQADPAPRLFRPVVRPPERHLLRGAWLVTTVVGVVVAVLLVALVVGLLRAVGQFFDSLPW